MVDLRYEQLNIESTPKTELPKGLWAQGKDNDGLSLATCTDPKTP